MQKTFKNFTALFMGRFDCLKSAEPLKRHSLLKSPIVPGTHLSGPWT